MSKPTPAYDPQSVGCECWHCPLRGKRVVLPKGPSNARVAIVGEAPGPQEEIAGEPFIGASGKLLDEILMKVGLRRREVFISNVLLCRPEVPNIQGNKKFDLPTYMAYIRAENRKRKKAAKESETTFIGEVEIKDPVSCCRPRLERELEYLDRQATAAGLPNGLVAIPVGAFALEVLTGRKGILKQRGSPLLPMFGPYKHPSGEDRDES